jgi:hypothetical protein
MEKVGSVSFYTFDGPLRRMNMENSFIRQILRHSMTRLNNKKMSAHAHSILPDEQSSTAAQWLESKQKEAQEHGDIPYIDEDIEDEQEECIRKSETKSEMPEQHKNKREETNKRYLKEVQLQQNENSLIIENTQVIPFLKKILDRGAKKDQNGEKVEKISQKMPTWFCAQKRKTYMVKSRSNQLVASDSAVSIIGRSESVVEQAELNGAFRKRNSIKKRMVRKLRRSLESFGTETTKRKSFDSIGKENKGSSSTIEKVIHGSTSTIEKDNQGSTSTIETVYVVEETKAKENALRRRVSFIEDEIISGQEQEEELSQQKQVKVNNNKGKLIRSISDVGYVRIAALKFKKRSQASLTKKEMVKDWNKNYEGMCHRAQKLELAIEIAEKEDLAVKPVNNFSTEMTNPDLSEQSKGKRKAINKGSFFSLCSANSIDTEVWEETLSRSEVEDEFRDTLEPEMSSKKNSRKGNWRQQRSQSFDEIQLFDKIEVVK